MCRTEVISLSARLSSSRRFLRTVSKGEKKNTTLLERLYAQLGSLKIHLCEAVPSNRELQQPIEPQNPIQG